MIDSGSIFGESPSFTSYSSNSFAEVAAKVCEEFVDDREELGLEPVSKEKVFSHHHEEQNRLGKEVDGDDDSGKNEEINDGNDDDFEFSFVCRDLDESPISADQIFVNGQIRPVFPVFNQDFLFSRDDHLVDDSKPNKSIRVSLKNLFREERESSDPPSSSSSEIDELENLPEGTYCIWTPNNNKTSSDSCKKSNSTGSSSSRRWRFRDFLFRSNSDGKDTFVFLTPSSSNENIKRKNHEKKPEISSDGGRKHSGESVITGKGISTGEEESSSARPSHNMIHYVKNQAVIKENDRRKSYLPYKQDLVGFFTNVNGLSRNLHPF